MKHVVAIAGREIRSLFVSPTAYVVLTLWAILAAVFFLSSLVSFQMELVRIQQFQQFELARTWNLNDHLIAPFVASMWIVLIFVVPGITMGLFASEKANGTEELLLTSPLTIWEIVLGKFLAGAAFVALMTGVVAFFPGVLFVYGDPEWGKTGASLLALFLLSLSYVSVGAFASSVTRNQLIAFFLALVILLVMLMLSFLSNIIGQGGAGGVAQSAGEIFRWLAPDDHFQNMLQGLVETSDLVYFAVIVGAFLMLAKASIESVRWR
ncbi:MAG: ABC transporter permease [Myxococcota bacterium]